MTLLEQIHPNFFNRSDIKNIPEDWGCFEEMVLELKDFYPCAYKSTTLPANVTFHHFAGAKEQLLAAVDSVDKGWPEFYTDDAEIFTAEVDGEIASFCLIEDFGIHEFNGKSVKVGGPGCVGTVSKYRKKGIGLEMVRQVTSILKDRGYDISYIHWTGVPDWYAKLGYKTVLKWNCHGICSE